MPTSTFIDYFKRNLKIGHFISAHQCLLIKYSLILTVSAGGSLSALLPPQHETIPALTSSSCLETVGSSPDSSQLSETAQPSVSGHIGIDGSLPSSVEPSDTQLFIVEPETPQTPAALQTQMGVPFLANAQMALPKGSPSDDSGSDDRSFGSGRQRAGSDSQSIDGDWYNTAGRTPRIVRYDQTLVPRGLPYVGQDGQLKAKFRSADGSRQEIELTLRNLGNELYYFLHNPEIPTPVFLGDPKKCCQQWTVFLAHSKTRLGARYREYLAYLPGTSQSPIYFPPVVNFIDPTIAEPPALFEHSFEWEDDDHSKISHAVLTVAEKENPTRQTKISLFSEPYKLEHSYTPDSPANWYVYKSLGTDERLEEVRETFSRGDRPIVDSISGLDQPRRFYRLSGFTLVPNAPGITLRHYGLIPYQPGCSSERLMPTGNRLPFIPRTLYRQFERRVQPGSSYLYRKGPDVFIVRHNVFELEKKHDGLFNLHVPCATPHALQFNAEEIIARVFPDGDGLYVLDGEPHNLHVHKVQSDLTLDSGCLDHPWDWNTVSGVDLAPSASSALLDDLKTTFLAGALTFKDLSLTSKEQDELVHLLTGHLPEKRLKSLRFDGTYLSYDHFKALRNAGPDLQIEGLTEEEQTLRVKLSTLEPRLATLIAKRQQLESDKVAKAKRIAELPGLIDRHSSYLSYHLGQVTSLTAQRQKKDAARAKTKEKPKKLEAQIRALETELQTQRAHLIGNQQTVASHKAEMDRLTGEISQLETMLNTVGIQIRDTARGVETAKTELAKEQAKAREILSALGS